MAEKVNGVGHLPASPPRATGGRGAPTVASPPRPPPPPAPLSPPKAGSKLKPTSQEWKPSATFLQSMEQQAAHPAVAVQQAVPHAASSPVSPHTEEELRRLLEGIFSEENLLKDRGLLRKLRGGMAPVDYVANFPRIKKVTGDRQVVAQAIRGSSMLQLSRDGRRVGRKDNPAILAEAAYRLVELMHLAPESTVSSVRAMTEPHGTVVHVDVFLEDEEAVARGAAPAFQQALVEFADAEAALRCVEALNRSASWRSGFRVGYHNGMTAEQAAKHVRKGKPAKGGAEEAKAHHEAEAAGGLGETTLIPPSLAEGTYRGEIASVEADGKGVIKREGRRRACIGFEPSAGKGFKAGDLVEYRIAHVEGKAVVAKVTKIANASSSSALPASPGDRSKAGGLGVTHSKLAHYILAKGPDGTIGFGMARTPRGSPGVSGGPGSAFFPPTPRDAIAPAVGGGGEAAV